MADSASVRQVVPAVPVVDNSQGLCVTGRKSDHLLVKEKLKAEAEREERMS